MSVGEFPEEIGIKNFGSKLGIEETWTDSVDSNAILSEFAGGSTSEVDYCTFTGVISDSWNFGVANDAIFVARSVPKVK